MKIKLLLKAMVIPDIRNNYSSMLFFINMILSTMNASFHLRVGGYDEQGNNLAQPIAECIVNTVDQFIEHTLGCDINVN